MGCLGLAACPQPSSQASSVHMRTQTHVHTLLLSEPPPTHILSEVALLEVEPGIGTICQSLAPGLLAL